MLRNDQASLSTNRRTARQPAASQTDQQLVERKSYCSPPDQRLAVCTPTTEPVLLNGSKVDVLTSNAWHADSSFLSILSLTAGPPALLAI